MNPLALVIGGFAAMVLAAKSLAQTPSVSIRNVVDQLPKHPTRRYGKRSIDQIRYLVIHHSSGDNQSPEMIARFHSTSDHLKKGGAPAIAYHFYLTEDGTIYQTNRLDTVSWHVANNNTPSVGICLSGNLDQHPPTEAQQKSIVALTKILKQQLPNPVAIKPHGYFKRTNCPGQYLDMNLFR